MGIKISDLGETLQEIDDYDHKQFVRLNDLLPSRSRLIRFIMRDMPEADFVYHGKFVILNFGADYNRVVAPEIEIISTQPVPDNFAWNDLVAQRIADLHSVEYHKGKRRFYKISGAVPDDFRDSVHAVVGARGHYQEILENYAAHLVDRYSRAGLKEKKQKNYVSAHSLTGA